MLLTIIRLSTLRPIPDFQTKELISVSVTLHLHLLSKPPPLLHITRLTQPSRGRSTKTGYSRPLRTLEMPHI